MSKLAGPDSQPTRRSFLVAAVSLAGGRALAGEKPKAKAGAEPEIGPGEDLMREHGVLRRVLIVYDEAARRIRANRPSPAETIVGGADLVHRFIEDYHELQEEQYVFPRFEGKGSPLRDLVAVLRQQHEVGRRLTDEIKKNAAASTATDRAALLHAIDAFGSMYRAHAAREDTVLFPALHASMSERAWDRLGDQFEETEKRVVGEHGFEKAVEEVARLERALGIFDLAGYTPAASPPEPR